MTDEAVALEARVEDGVEFIHVYATQHVLGVFPGEDAWLPVTTPDLVRCVEMGSLIRYAEGGVRLDPPPPPSTRCCGQA